MVSVPPPCIASAALTIIFMKTCFNWPGISADEGQEGVEFLHDMDIVE